MLLGVIISLLSDIVFCDDMVFPLFLERTNPRNMFSPLVQHSSLVYLFLLLSGGANSCYFFLSLAVFGVFLKATTPGVKWWSQSVFPFFPLSFNKKGSNSPGCGEDLQNLTNMPTDGLEGTRTIKITHLFNLLICKSMSWVFEAWLMIFEGLGLATQNKDCTSRCSSFTSNVQSS